MSGALAVVTLSGEPPAGEIRRAAALLRERAEKATPGSWQHMCLGSEGCLVLRKSGTVRERGRARVARFGQKEWKADHADAEFVAGMSPPVALAVAEWLDMEAHMCEVRGNSLEGHTFHALKVARAYLAEAEAEQAEAGQAAWTEGQ